MAMGAMMITTRYVCVRVIRVIRVDVGVDVGVGHRDTCGCLHDDDEGNDDDEWMRAVRVARARGRRARRERTRRMVLCAHERATRAGRTRARWAATRRESRGVSPSATAWVDAFSGRFLGGNIPRASTDERYV